jgi:hypothetical protein
MRPSAFSAGHSAVRLGSDFRLLYEFLSQHAIELFAVFLLYHTFCVSFTMLSFAQGDCFGNLLFFYLKNKTAQNKPKTNLAASLNKVS